MKAHIPYSLFDLISALSPQTIILTAVQGAYMFDFKIIFKNIYIGHYGVRNRQLAIVGGGA